MRVLYNTWLPLSLGEHITSEICVIRNPISDKRRLTFPTVDWFPGFSKGVQREESFRGLLQGLLVVQAQTQHIKDKPLSSQASVFLLSSKFLVGVGVRGGRGSLRERVQKGRRRPGGRPRSAVAGHWH